MGLNLGRKLVACATICVAAGLGIGSTTAANAATGAASSTQTVQLQLTRPASSGAHSNVSAGGQLYLCWASMSGGAVENNYITVSVGATCQIPSFIVNGSIVYANNSHVYASTSTIGKSNSSGTYFSTKVQKGGTIGYRSAQWCVDITLSNGAIASGCLRLTGM